MGKKVVQIISNLGRAGIELGTLWSEGRDLNTNCTNHACRFTVIAVNLCMTQVFWNSAAKRKKPTWLLTTVSAMQIYKLKAFIWAHDNDFKFSSPPQNYCLKMMAFQVITRIPSLWLKFFDLFKSNDRKSKLNMHLGALVNSILQDSWIGSFYGVSYVLPVCI